MRFGIKRRLVKGAPAGDLCGPVRRTVRTAEGVAQGEVSPPYSAEVLDDLLRRVRPLTLAETERAARNRRQFAGDRAAMEVWYEAECRGRTGPQGGGRPYPGIEQSGSWDNAVRALEN